jgi:predicted membrane metal-binding protein
MKLQLPPAQPPRHVQLPYILGFVRAARFIRGVLIDVLASAVTAAAVAGLALIAGARGRTLDVILALAWCALFVLAALARTERQRRRSELERDVST